MPALITKRTQLQWLALLAVAVLLPTVSLLWFLSRVVANERLVIRQKLAGIYQDKLAEAAAKTESLFAARLTRFDGADPAANPYSLFRSLVIESNVQGIVLWNSSGKLIYPRTVEATGNDVSPDSPLAEAQRQEFAGNHYGEAARLYERLASDSDPRMAIIARLGQSRCLARLGRRDEAIEAARQAAFASTPDNPDPTLQRSVANARLGLLSLLTPPPSTGRASLIISQTATGLTISSSRNRRGNEAQMSSGMPQTVRASPRRLALYEETIKALFDDLYSPQAHHPALPANQNLFIAQKMLQALEAAPQLAEAKETNDLSQLIAAESLSLSVAQSVRPSAAPFDTLFRMNLPHQTLYGLRHRTPSLTWLLLFSDGGIASALSGYREVFARSEAVYRILGASGEFVGGARTPRGQPFATTALPAAFPGWKVELYFKGGDVFERAAQRQIAVYVWTGVLLILLILITGGFATRAVGRQIRLNRMKNDFIATVSHELKTPLASMRVLIDTLLEGRVRSEAQATEYLRMTAKENERLSRMIDNFLTFSRMERNKKAFTLADAQPAAIARDAIASLQPKFAAHHCQFSVDIAEHLPEIQADHDAMVTVLVNLLDNACKYTGTDKQIALRVFGADDTVCFAVSDNGIGLARRQARRIFDSFYQVDSSLARKAEGCGLGLSIVKFIVDTHKGKVTVESKPGQGSTFTVALPVSPANGE